MRNTNIQLTRVRHCSRLYAQPGCCETFRRNHAPLIKRAHLGHERHHQLENLVKLLRTKKV